MVTFWLVAVVSVNPAEDTLVIVPTDPPAAGPDRALDPESRANPISEVPCGGIPLVAVAEFAGVPFLEPLAVIAYAPSPSATAIGTATRALSLRRIESLFQRVMVFGLSSWLGRADPRWAGAVIGFSHPRKETLRPAGQGTTDTDSGRGVSSGRRPWAPVATTNAIYGS